MCGIVLVGAASVMSTKDISLFEKLLFCDTFRGDHSTGVMSGYFTHGTTPDYFVDVNKAALNGPEFIKSEAWASAKSRYFDVLYQNARKPVRTLKTPYFMVGHNRYATMGAKTATNAHPFQVGNVTLVHNGTLVDQDLLPDSAAFEVDSHNIAHAINKEGIVTTLTKLDGAFTLIWHDARDNTVNIIRNEERPFHLAQTASGDWFGASEEDMLMWILTRENKYSKYKSGPTVKTHFECEVGVQYIFDVSTGKFVFKESIKHELPVFPVKTKTAWWNSYAYGSSSARSNDYGTSTRSSATSYNSYSQSANYLLEHHGVGVKTGETLKFCGFDHSPYPSNPNSGLLEGYVDNLTEYVEVKAHAIDASLYRQYGNYTGVIQNAYLKNGSLTIIVSSVKALPPEEEEVKQKKEDVDGDEPPFDTADTVVRMDDGLIFTKQQWVESDLSTCTRCMTAIKFEEAEVAASYGNMGYICYQCEQELTRDVADCGFALLPAPRDPNDFEETFTCEGCKEDVALSKESEFLYGFCEECADSYYDARASKQLDDGQIYNETQWASINTCVVCGNDVPWEVADKCSVQGEHVTCINCL